MNFIKKISRVVMMLAAILIACGDMTVYAAREKKRSRGVSFSAAKSRRPNKSSPRATHRSPSRSGMRGASKSISRGSRSRTRTSRVSRTRTTRTNRNRAKKTAQARTRSSKVKRASSRASSRASRRRVKNSRTKSQRATKRTSGRKTRAKTVRRKLSRNKARGRRTRKATSQRSARRANRSTRKNRARSKAADKVARASSASPVAGLTGVGTAAAVAQSVPLAADARVGLGIATTPAGKAIGVSLGADLGWFGNSRFYGEGWGWQSPFWGGCGWYPRIGFWSLFGGGCWFNPWLSACIFPWNAGLIATGLWPAWVFPWFGCTMYSVATYPGCILRVEPEEVSNLWCGVYYRDPESGFLIRYIEPRVVEREIIKVNVPVRYDHYERVVVISRNQAALGRELPEEPVDGADYRYIALNDPEDVEPQDAPGSLEFEDLSDEELDKIAQTNKAIKEKTNGKDLKKLDELRDLDLENADLKRKEEK